MIAKEPTLTSSDLPWHSQAQRLLDQIISRYDEKYGLSSMSGSIYDTAWVSLVSKNVDGKHEWVFPECFQFVYDSQMADGGWVEYGDPVDRLMNTLAALFSLIQHKKTPLWPGSDVDIAERISKAHNFLSAKLVDWDVAATDYVGFEVLIPAMLGYLEHEGFQFEFPGKAPLYELNAKKMSMFHPKIIYARPTTLLHSMEGFIGKVNFDLLKPHLVNGGLMASPSSTAAYLMNCSTWDSEAEEYLRHVVQNCRPYGEGVVPAAFPTTVFELSWVICNLFENGFNRELLDSKSLQKITSILETTFVDGKGLVGFAPGLGTDADDTAKTIVALQYLGVQVSPDALVTKYEAKSHFHTYELERNPSFTVNCNVLLALLHAPESKKYQSQVEKTVNFLCNKWWTSDGGVEDKWHLSKYYAFMLLSQAMIRFLHFWGSGHFPEVQELLVRHKIPIMLFQVLLRTLNTQSADGSFGSKGSLEETSYAVIALANLASLPFVEKSPLYSKLETAISEARDFLRRHGGVGAPYIKSQEYLWVEKVTYASDHLHNSYILGALSAPVPAYNLSIDVDNLVDIPWKKVAKFTQFYAQIPLFSEQLPWQLQGSLIEGYLFLPELSRIKLDVFKREGFNEDKYLEYIPFTWTATSNLDRTFAGPNLVFDLSWISLMNYQVDEYVEAVIGVTFTDRLEDVRRVVESLFTERVLECRSPKAESTSGATNGKVHGYQNGKVINGKSNGHDPLHTIPEGMADLHHTLSTFVETVLSHPRINMAHPNNRQYLIQELRSYLLAQVAQGVCNERFRHQKAGRRLFETPQSSYRKWARRDASDHVSCHFAFAFLVCLMSHQLGGGEDCFPTEEIKYVAEDCCSHIAVLSRMYNDYGSIIRDRDEGNINSINFPEFRPQETEDSELKKKLMRLIDYERRCFETGMNELEVLCDERRKRVFQLIRLFSNTCYFYGQLYVVKDLTCRI